MNIDWMLAIQGLVLGLGAVFTVLVILIILIFILGKIVRGASKKDTPKEKTAQPITTKVSVPKNDEDEIAAVIIAAIACIEQREGKRFKIRSFRRV